MNRTLVDAEVLSTNAHITTRVRFKDSSGNPIYTVVNGDSYTQGSHTILLAHAVPSNAASAVVGVSVEGAGKEVWFDHLAMVEDPVIPSGEECSDKAEEARIARYNDCTAEGGIPTGNCTGDSVPDFPGGCMVSCAVSCLKSSEPREVQCSAYF
jgi:hypothetical protein